MVKVYMAPTAEKVGDEAKPRTKILIDEEWCKACGICIEFCPKGILVPTGLEGKPTVTDPSLCIKCMLCEVRCPDFAIRVRSEEDDDDES
jgi:2-oxoglutarate ferredoxin oxidoreductase subunit delta